MSRLRLIAVLFAAACASPAPSVQERLIPTSGGRVYARTGGAGPDVVLLHGLGDSAVAWRKVEEPLRRAGYRVTVWDALGAGLSEKPRNADLTLPAHVQRLEEALEHLRIERAVLVGNSLGGSMALLFAKTHPERVRALVLEDPAAYLDEETLSGAWIWQTPGLAEAGLAVLKPEWIADLGLERVYGDPGRITDADREVYTREAARFGVLEMFLEQERQVLPTPEQAAEWARGFARIGQPTLILWGTADELLPLAHGHRLAAEMPHARLVELFGVGHTAHQEAPGRFLAVTLDFLATLP